jgi:hypothetical protein
MAQCRVCGKGPMQGVTVYRMNEPGVEGIWACQDHRSPPTDLVLQAFLDDLEAVVLTPVRPRPQRLEDT